jgi:hypothetical protein
MQRELMVFTGLLATMLGCILVIYLNLRSRSHARELLSKERLAALDRGLEIPMDYLPPRASRNPLKLAIFLLAAGIGLSGSLFILSERGQEWAFGLPVLVIGLGHLAYYFLGGRREWQQRVALETELYRASLRRLDSGRQGTPADEATR